MKKLLLALLALSSSIVTFSQGNPYGYSMNDSELNSIETYELTTFDQDELIRRAEDGDKMGQMSMYGEIINTTVDIAAQGTWTTDLDGNQICQFRFRTANAKAVGAIFSDFNLPQGAFYFIYSADRSYFEGPFDASENHESGIYRTPEVFGDEAIIEYVQPANVIGTPRLVVRGFIHFYRFIYDYRDDRASEDRGSSDPCEVDVNCPEGDPWEDQKNAEVRLSLVAGNGVGLCSGTLVNNTSYDCKNYILTAMHCTIDSNTSDLLASTVRFRYQRANCGSGSAPAQYQKVGLILRADSNDGGGATGSDFALVEMDDAIPSSWNAFYAGWYAGTDAPTADGNGHRVWGIHHPSGDVKKISTGGSVSSATWGASNHHWRVNWVQTETNWGVTEGGSSGSPIYNKDKRIVGTLTGGGSFCTSPSSPDYYGKMDKHWTGNPNPSNEDLVDWLDAAGTGLIALDGAYPGPSLSAPCTPTTTTQVNELQFNDFQLYPTLASDFIQITTDKYRSLQEVRLFDATGKLVDTFNLNGPAMQYSVNELQTGMYFIIFVGHDGQHVSQKFTVSR